MTQRFTEHTVLFGRSMSLVGILTRPSRGIRVQKRAVVILNTGIVHRVGHHRMYVTMARKFAASGHISFRFDFSGVGDSASRGGGLTPLQSCLKDVAEAIDWLEASHQVDEIVLIGLCAGADVALNYGRTDKRVVGLVLLDPTIPPTTRFYLNYIGGRLTQIRSWRSFIQGRGRIWQESIERISFMLGAFPEQPTSLNDPRIRCEFEQMFIESLERNLNILCVLTDGAEGGRHNYRDQLFDACPNVPLQGRVSVEHFSDADHTFTPESSRKKLIALVLSWIKTPAMLIDTREIPNMRTEVGALRLQAKIKEARGRMI